MYEGGVSVGVTVVALRKESVDRNIRRCSIWVLQS